MVEEERALRSGGGILDKSLGKCTASDENDRGTKRASGETCFGCGTATANNVADHGMLI